MGAGATVTAENIKVMGSILFGYPSKPGDDANNIESLGGNNGWHSPSTATSTIAASTASIVANGSSTTTITVQLKDRDDNNLTTSGGTVTLTTTAGSLGSVTDNNNGTYSVILTSPTTVGPATI